MQIVSDVASIAFALEPIGGRMFATLVGWPLGAFQFDGLYSLHVDGSDIHPLSGGGPEYLSTAPGHEWVYALFGDNSIQKFKLSNDGSVTGVVLSEAIPPRSGLSFDALRGALYFAEYTTPNVIKSLDLETLDETVVVENSGAVLSIVVDAARGVLYWTTISSGIFRVNLNSGQVEKIVGGSEHFKASALHLECGNLSVDDGETCDIYSPEGEPGSCPRSCLEFDQDPCTRNLLIDENTCSARCELTDITEPRSFDGCCPPGGIAGRDNDCGERFIVPAMSGVGQAVLALAMLAMIAVRFRKVRPDSS